MQANKTIIGAGDGLGGAIAKAFARGGHPVCMTRRARNLDQLEALAGEIRAEGANTSATAARGAFGIPTFFVGDEMFFGKKRLGQVEEELKLHRIE